MALADRSPAPDLIHCCLPTLDLADAAAKLGKKYDIPTTLDIRDLWPDVFYDRLPKALRFLGPTLLSPYNSLARNACRYATALTGNSPKFVEWGLLKAAREATPYDVPFPFGYHEPKLTASEIDKADQFWERLGINDGNALPIACFFGKIGYQFQFDSLIQGIKTYLANNKALFVLCGNGPTLDDLRRGCRDEPHIIFPGLVDKSQIWRLMAKSKIALAPYNDSVNFRDNLANKLIEYMAGAVPVLYSLDEGYVADLIREHEIGLTYGSSSERLAQAIHRLLDDEAYRRRLSDNARNLYLKKYQGEKIYSEMAAHLENIVKNSGK